MEERALPHTRAPGGGERQGFQRPLPAVSRAPAGHPIGQMTEVGAGTRLAGRAIFSYVRNTRSGSCMPPARSYLPTTNFPELTVQTAGEASATLMIKRESK